MSVKMKCAVCGARAKCDEFTLEELEEGIDVAVKDSDEAWHFFSIPDETDTFFIHYD